VAMTKAEIHIRGNLRDDPVYAKSEKKFYRVGVAVKTGKGY
jgi:hypothetical protein